MGFVVREPSSFYFTGGCSSEKAQICRWKRTCASSTVLTMLIIHSTYWDEVVWARVLDMLDRRAVQDGCLWRSVRRPLLASFTEVVTNGNSKELPVIHRELLGKTRCGQLKSCHTFCVTDDGWQYFHHNSNATTWAFQTTLAGMWGLRPNIHQCFTKDEAPSDLKRLFPSVVLATRFLSSEERRQLFSMSNVLVHASRSEGFGLSVAQAMAAGLSVITTDKGAVAEFISGDTVWQVKSNYVPCTAFPCSINDAIGVNVPSLFGLPTNAMPKWLNYSTTELGKMMRRTWNEPITAQRKADKAKNHVMDNMQWASVATVLRNRLHAFKEGRFQM